MRGWWKRLRGFVGLTSVGGFAGALFGGAGSAVASLLGTGGVDAQVILLGAAVWGGIAGVATAGVAAFLAAGGPRESLAGLSPAKAGLVGLAIGATAPFLVVTGIKLLFLGIAPTISVSLASSMVIGGALCGSIGAGLVTVAKRTDAALLEDGDPALLHSRE